MVHARHPFGPTEFVASIQLVAGRVASFDKYPFSIPAVAALKTKLELSGGATFFVGENGSGKSTLVEAIAVAMRLNAEGGTKNLRFATRRSESELHGMLRVVKGVRRPTTGFFLRAESFYNVATQIDELGVTDYYGGNSLHEQSHGESFLTLIQHRFSPGGLYILDEPEAALSPRRQLVLLKRMYELIARGSQFIVATHSPILLALPGARICQLDENGITHINYDDADPVQLTRAFLEDPKTFLDMLLPKAKNTPA